MTSIANSFDGYNKGREPGVQNEPLSQTIAFGSYEGFDVLSDPQIFSVRENNGFKAAVLISGRGFVEESNGTIIHTDRLDASLNSGTWCGISNDLPESGFVCHIQGVSSSVPLEGLRTGEVISSSEPARGSGFIGGGLDLDCLAGSKVIPKRISGFKKPRKVLKRKEDRVRLVVGEDFRV